MTIDYEQQFEDVIESIFETGHGDAEEALRILIRHGMDDGAHHKMWVIDQAVRALAGGYYEELIAAANGGEDGPETYAWDIGIAP
jgi:hypothetical protein